MKIYTSTPYLLISDAASTPPRLKISFHGTSDMMTKTFPTCTKKIRSCAMQRNIRHWDKRKISRHWKTTSSEFFNGGKVTAEQKLRSYARNRSKGSGLWVSQSVIPIGKLYISSFVCSRWKILWQSSPPGDLGPLVRAGKIRFSSAWKSVLLRVSSGERCAPRNFEHLVTLRGHVFASSCT